MKFFDDKEEVIDIQLTQFGKHLLSLGKWKPAYYAFFDDNVMYDAESAGITEAQNKIEPRIQENTPQLHTQHVFTGRETDFLKIVGTKDDPFMREEDKINVQSTPEKDYSLVSPLGNSAYGSQAAPRWSVKVLQGKITNTEGFLTGSYRTLKIPIEVCCGGHNGYLRSVICTIHINTFGAKLVDRCGHYCGVDLIIHINVKIVPHIA